MEAGEQCDDGNSNDEDGCTTQCRFCPESVIDFPSYWTVEETGGIESSGNDIAVDRCNVYVTGQKRESLVNGDDMYTAKYDGTGSLQWGHLFHETPIPSDLSYYHDYGIGIAIGDRSVYVVGILLDGYTRSIAVRRYNADGTTDSTLTHVYSDRYFSAGTDIVTDNSDNVYAVGRTTDDVASAITRYWIAKYPASFLAVSGPPWPMEETIEGTSAGAQTVALDNIGNIYIGTSRSDAGGAVDRTTQSRIKKITPEGLSDEGFGTGSVVNLDDAVNYRIRAIKIDAAGNIYVLGEHYDGGVIQNKLVKLNPDGSPFGEPFPIRMFPELTNLGLKGMAMDAEENIYVVGRASAGGVIAKFDTAGNLLWREIMAGSHFHSIAVGLDNSIYVTGRSSARYLLIRKYTPCGISDDGPPDVQNDPACAGP